MSDGAAMHGTQRRLRSGRRDASRWGARVLCAGQGTAALGWRVEVESMMRCAGRDPHPPREPRWAT